MQSLNYKLTEAALFKAKPLNHLRGYFCDFRNRFCRSRLQKTVKPKRFLFGVINRILTLYWPRDWRNDDVDVGSQKGEVRGCLLREGRMTGHQSTQYSMIDSRYFLSRDIMAALHSGGQFPWQNDPAIYKSAQPSNACSRTRPAVRPLCLPGDGGEDGLMQYPSRVVCADRVFTVLHCHLVVVFLNLVLFISSPYFYV